MYYGNYLKIFQRARTQYLEERGYRLRVMKEGTVFVVVHAEVDYRSPAAMATADHRDGRLRHDGSLFTFSHVVRERESRRVVVEGRKLRQWMEMGSEATRKAMAPY